MDGKQRLVRAMYPQVASHYTESFYPPDPGAQIVSVSWENDIATVMWLCPVHTSQTAQQTHDEMIKHARTH